MPPMQSSEADWDRQPDGTILRLSFSTTVAKDSVIELLEQILADAGFDHSSDEPAYKALSSAPLGKNFIFQSTGSPNIGAIRAAQVLESIRLPGGRWKDYRIESPAGDQIKMYIGGDRTEKFMAEDRAGKLFLKHVQDVFASKKINFEFRERSK